MKTEEKKSLIDVAYEKAKEVINICSTKHGLYASGGSKGYKGVWSRDSVISMMGASLVADEKYAKKFQDQFRRSLTTLGNKQSKKGQIPNAVHGWEHNKVYVNYLSIDSTLWWIIGHYIYKKRYKDESLFHRDKEKIEKAINWLSFQDMGENVLLQQPPTTDWQDAFPHKYGHTLNTQALYYKVLNLMDKPETASKLKKHVNHNKELQLWNGDYYWAYRWKNHNKYREIGGWFDSLGNMMAIVFGLAGKTIANKIIDHVESKKINKPYALKTIYPPIRKSSKDWKDYYQDCAAGKPYNYLNGGIWPFIGGFYILALIKLRKFKEAEKELEKNAEANLKSNLFPEWINPIDKKSHGHFQAWSAGMYILAYESLKKKKVLI